MMATQTDEQQTIDHDDDWEDEPRQSIEDKAENGEGAESDGPPPLEGATKQLSLLAGGEEPDSSTFKVRGGSIPVEGEFEKGSVVTLQIKVSVDEVTFADKKDNDGYVVATERRHIAKIMSVHRL